MDSYKIAIDMYKNEHSRWSTWTIFFFGSIISVFTVHSQIKSFIPLWMPLSLSALLSATWIFVCLSIRASTQTWRKVILHLESNGKEGTNNGLSVFTLFDQKKAEFHTVDDFIRTITFKKENGDWTFSSVTRLLTFQGAVFTLLFIILLISHIKGLGTEVNQRTEEEKYKIYQETVTALSQYAVDAIDSALQQNKKQRKGAVWKTILRPTTYEALSRSRSLVQAFFSQETLKKMDSALKCTMSIDNAPNEDFESARTEAIKAMARELRIIS